MCFIHGPHALITAIALALWAQYHTPEDLVFSVPAASSSHLAGAASHIANIGHYRHEAAPKVGVSYQAVVLDVSEVYPLAYPFSRLSTTVARW